MSETITPVNISGAAIIAQVSIIVIMFLGALIVRISEEITWTTTTFQNTSSLAWIILFFALVTIGCLVFSDELSSVWRPLFSSVTFPTLRWSTALLIAITLGIICITILVALTKGVFGNRQQSFAAKEQGTSVNHH